MLNLSCNEIDNLWNEGYRPFEIYTFNKKPVEYYGAIEPAGSISGWDIEHVFAKREELKDYPFFDATIALSDMSLVTHIWKGL
jgi:hypothetical protein